MIKVDYNKLMLNYIKSIKINLYLLGLHSFHLNMSPRRIKYYVKLKVYFYINFMLERNFLIILINTLTSWQLDESGSLNYYDHEIRVIEAPEPTDIDWRSI